ncbi:MAG: hypothetical protein M1536_02115, partial [Firmicutes bacterium]|nr:hypothetical protein [Bacillota bacterium]
MSIIDGSMRIPEKVIQPAVEKKSEVIKEAEAHPRSEDKVTLGEKVKGLAEEAVGFAIAAPVAAVALPVGIIGNAIKGGERGAIKALGAKNRFPEGDTVKIAGRVGQNKLVIKFDRVGERDAVEAASVFGPLVPLYVLYGLAGYD